MVDTAPTAPPRRAGSRSRTPPARCSASAATRARVSGTSPRRWTSRARSLYAHVASKEDVLWAIVVRAADRFDAAVAPIAAETLRPAQRRLARMIAAHIAVIADDLGNAASFLQEWRFLSPERREAIATRRDGYEAPFRTRDRGGIAAGEFDGDVDPHLAATLILSALNGVAGWYRPTGALTAGQIADRYTDLLLRAADDYPMPKPRRGPSMTDPLALDPVLAPVGARRAAFQPAGPRRPRALRRLRGARPGRRQGRGERLDARRVPDAVLRFVEMHANSRADGRAAGARVDHARADAPRKLALTAKVQDECGPRAAALPRRRGPGQEPRADVPGPARRQDEVPQRLPLPDPSWARCRDHRVARRCRRDRRPAGAPRVELRARTPAR